MLKLSTNRKMALMKACTDRQEGPPHGHHPKKEMVGATYTHTEKIKDEGCHMNTLRLRNFCFYNISSLRNYKTIHFNSKAYFHVIGSK